MNINPIFTGITFQDYISHIENLLKKYPSDFDHPSFINSRIPFELKPKKKTKKAIILVHGLFSFCQEFSYISEFFKSKNFLVRNIMLSGHGLDRSIFTPSKNNWIHDLYRIISITQKEGFDIYLGGMSTGALLSINAVLDGLLIKGLFLFSPGSQIKSISKSIPTLISYAITFYPEVIQSKKYEKVNSKDTLEYYSLYHSVKKKINRNLSPIKTPVFSCLSLDDHIIEQKQTLKMLNHFENQKTLIFTSKKKPENTHKRLYISSFLPDKKIIGIPHGAILFPPSDPNFGEKSPIFHPGKYHGVPSLSNIVSQIKKISPNIKSYQSSFSSLLEQNIYLLTFNPLFDLMIGELHHFIKENDF